MRRRRRLSRRPSRQPKTGSRESSQRAMPRSTAWPPASRENSPRALGSTAWLLASRSWPDETLCRPGIHGAKPVQRLQRGARRPQEHSSSTWRLQRRHLPARAGHSPEALAVARMARALQEVALEAPEGQEAQDGLMANQHKVALEEEARDSLTSPCIRGSSRTRSPRTRRTNTMAAPTRGHPGAYSRATI